MLLHLLPRLRVCKHVQSSAMHDMQQVAASSSLVIINVINGNH
jgi:hypothetical protein